MKNVETEVAFRLVDGELKIAYTLESCENRFTLSKESAWDDLISDQAQVVDEENVAPLAQLKRKHLHDRLDMWIDGNWQFTRIEVSE